MLSDTGALNELRPSHIGVVVKDAEATSKSLSSVWGLGPWTTFEYPCAKEQTIVGEPFTLKIMYTKLGPITLELLQPVESPRSVWGQHIEKHGEGIHHIAFRLKNFDEKIKELEAQGSKMLVHAKVKGGKYDGRQWCYMEMKPGGIVVELMDDFEL